jgi:hypothetical protein
VSQNTGRQRNEDAENPNIYAAVVWLLPLPAIAPVTLAEERIFIFGNSYTYFNGGIESMVKARSFEYNRRIQRSTGNGAKLPRHLLNLDGTNAVTRRRGKH